MSPSKYLGALTVEDRAKLEQRLASQSVGPMLYLGRPIGPGASEGRGNSTSITSTHWRYARVSKADGSQSLDLQRDALRAAGVDAVHVYHDFAAGVRDDRPGLDSCVRALRTGDVLVVWKLDRLGRTLVHLVNTVQDLSNRGVGLRVLTGQGAQIDTTTAAGRLVFGIFAALAEFERELIRERTLVGLTAARARGRHGGRTFALSKAQLRLAQAAMAHRDTPVSALCRELGITPGTLYRYVGPQGQLREQGEKVLAT